MKLIGFLLWSLGVAVIAYATLIYDTSVSAPLGAVVNVYKQQQQTMMVIVGVGAFVAGVVLHAIGIKMTPVPMPDERQEPVTDIPPPYMLAPATVSETELSNQAADAEEFMRWQGAR